MKFTISTILCVAVGISGTSQAFTPLTAFGGAVSHRQVSASSSSSRYAIRSKTEKLDELRFGWDGTTALGMFCKEMIL
jgi:hypothetical protein